EKPSPVPAPKPEAKPEASQDVSTAGAGLAPPDARRVGDASFLRLAWGEPLPALLKKARERRAAVGALPLLLALDWLRPDRPAPLGDSVLPDATTFGEACGRLAAEVRPEHFEVAADLNVFLARKPEQADAVRTLIRAAAQAIHAASPETKVVVSLNRE